MLCCARAVRSSDQYKPSRGGVLSDVCTVPSAEPVFLTQSFWDGWRLTVFAPRRLERRSHRETTRSHSQRLAPSYSQPPPTSFWKAPHTAMNNSGNGIGGAQRSEQYLDGAQRAVKSRGNSRPWVVGDEAFTGKMRSEWNCALCDSLNAAHHFQLSLSRLSRPSRFQF